MAIEPTLRNAIIEFLLNIPYLHDKEGRKATLYSAGLRHVMPDVDLSGTPRDVISALLEQLEHGGKLDGQFVLIRFLEAVTALVGQEGRVTLQHFCEQLPNQLPETPQSRPHRPDIPFQRPPRVPFFTDRKEELALLLCQLQPGQVVTLCGPGGVGKSALATEVVWRMEPERFPDGVIFHSFYGQPDPNVALEHIARSCGVDPQPTPVSAALQALAGKKNDKQELGQHSFLLTDIDVLPLDYSSTHHLGKGCQYGRNDMVTQVSPGKLTNLQLELLKLFSYQLNEQDLSDVKDLLAQHFANKATQEMNEFWETRHLDEAAMQEWLEEHYRTPYSP